MYDVVTDDIDSSNLSSPTTLRKFVPQCTRLGSWAIESMDYFDRELGSNLDRSCGTATRFLSNHLVIEISADVIRYKPRLQSRLIPWLSLGLIPLLFPGWIRRTALVQGEIDLKLVNSFQADPGWPILGSPSISIELLDRGQPRKVTFFLQRYLLIPRRAYDGMIWHLRSLGIREESVAPSRGLRALSWLFVPILIIIGWQVAKGTNGIMAIYGAGLVVLGILLVCGSLIEVGWYVLRTLLGRAGRR